MSSDAIRDMILTARMQARLASAVYFGDQAVRAVAENAKARYRYYTAANVTAAALIFDDHAHLSICGTNDRYDWALNLNRNIVPIGICEGHEGFFDAARWISREVVGRGFGAFLCGRKLYLGGHSAGGAIAEILPLINSDLRPEATYSFGSPKWCSTKTSAKYWSQSWRSHRFVMPSDPVPYTPLSLWRSILGVPTFSHAAIAIEVQDSGKYAFQDEFGCVKKCLAFGSTVYAGGLALVATAAKRALPLLQSHGSNRYMVALENAAKEWTR